MAKPVIPDWGSDDDGSSEYGSEDVYEVERIIAERTSKGAKQYLVKWAGFGEEQCTWGKESETPTTL
jgi:Chromo (CHRromatin Organisation MOdifier) domain